ncbi:hypothetical protein [Streptomyces aurantiogriseus]|uniref:hypothetical protein n=1 Tax=Streptomyces aurantiogriseus TaxID=66870 RepID=UPI001672C80C|nr:hypothetical protein [Streptomyces aurantiogriseus]
MSEAQRQATAEKPRGAGLRVAAASWVRDCVGRASLTMRPRVVHRGPSPGRTTALSS